MIEAAYYEREPGNLRVRCDLCPHGCRIEAGGRGLCGVRENLGGFLYAGSYQEIVELRYGRIEEHAFFQYRPATRVLFLGIAGDTLHWDFLGEIPGEKPSEPSRWLCAEEAVDHALGKGCSTIVVGHGDPLAGFEFLLEIARRACDCGVAVALSTRGFVNAEPLDALVPFLGAANVMLASVRRPVLRSGGRNRVPPLEAAIRLRERVHLEISYALAPDVNDDSAGVRRAARWIAENLGFDTPVHVVGAAPRGRPELALASIEDRYAAQDIFHEHLRHVYVWDPEAEEGCHTYCPECGSELVHRSLDEVTTPGLMPSGECTVCGHSGVVEW